MKRVVSNGELIKLGIHCVYAPTNHYEMRAGGHIASLTIKPELLLWQIVELVMEKGIQIGIGEGKRFKIQEIRRALNEVD